MTTTFALDVTERRGVSARHRQASPARIVVPGDTRRAEPVHPHGSAPAGGVRDGETPRRTLDDLITGVWEGLSSHHTVTCPVCSGKMTPRYGSGARPVGGRCGRCGSTLG
jgi:hypothetical protein